MLVTARINDSNFSMAGSSRNRAATYIAMALFAAMITRESSAFTLVGPGVHIGRERSVHLNARSAKSYAQIPPSLRNCALRMAVDKFHATARDIPSSLDDKTHLQHSSMSEKRPATVFSRAELLRASLLAGLISLAQPLIAAATALAANQEYDRWWVFPLAPFSHKKTSVAEVVPGQV
jgi:hypothetical protein